MTGRTGVWRTCSGWIGLRHRRGAGGAGRAESIFYRHSSSRDADHIHLRPDSPGEGAAARHALNAATPPAHPFPRAVASCRPSFHTVADAEYGRL